MSAVKSGFFGTFGAIIALVFVFIVLPLGAMFLICGGCVVVGVGGSKLAEEGQRIVEEQHAKEAAERIKVKPVEPIPIEEPAPVVEPEPVSQPELRTWQSPSGAFKLEASFVRFANGKVTLRKADGKEVEVEVAKLSDDDKAWIESRRTKP